MGQRNGCRNTAGVSPGLPKIVPLLGIHVSSTDQSCRCTQHSQLFTVAAAFGHYFLGSKKETQLNLFLCQDHGTHHGPEPGKFPNGSPLPRNTCTTLAKPKLQKDCGVQESQAGPYDNLFGGMWGKTYSPAHQISQRALVWTRKQPPPGVLNQQTLPCLL